jgi:hypothetical protein
MWQQGKEAGAWQASQQASKQARSGASAYMTATEGKEYAAAPTCTAQPNELLQEPAALFQ